MIHSLSAELEIECVLCTIGTAKLEQTVTHYPTILLVFIAHLYLPIWIPFWQSALYNAHIQPLSLPKSGIMTLKGRSVATHRAIASIGTLSLII